MKDLDETYAEYKSQTNMTYSELLAWSRTPCSRKASLDRRPIRRNLKLLSKPKSQWNKADMREAKKAISYLKRAKKIRSNNFVKECGYTVNEIALKNWAWDAKK